MIDSDAMDLTSNMQLTECIALWDFRRVDVLSREGEDEICGEARKVDDENERLHFFRFRKIWTECR